MVKKWMTGQEAMDAHDLRPIELFRLIENGLPAYHPDTLRRYYPMAKVFSSAGERMEWRQWEGVVGDAGEGGAVHGTAEDLQGALDRGRTPTPEELENAEPYTGRLEQIVGAVFKPGDVALAVSGGQAVGLDPEKLTDVKKRALRANELQRRGLTVEQIAEELHPDVFQPDSAKRAAQRDLALAKKLLSGGEKPRA